jgi:rhodanese-related sulfurtransferase
MFEERGNPMKRTGSIALMILAITAGSAFAQTGETPMTLDGARTVSVVEAKALVDGGASVFDVRRKTAYVEGRIGKAKSIAKNEAKVFEAVAFGGKMDAVIVIYGHGSDGWSSVDAVKTAVSAGYKNVNWLRGGFAEWSKAGMPVVE